MSSSSALDAISTTYSIPVDDHVSVSNPPTARTLAPSTVIPKRSASRYTSFRTQPATAR